jgi:hypothetical protein
MISVHKFNTVRSCGYRNGCLVHCRRLCCRRDASCSGSCRPRVGSQVPRHLNCCSMPGVVLALVLQSDESVRKGKHSDWWPADRSPHPPRSTHGSPSNTCYPLLHKATAAVPCWLSSAWTPSRTEPRVCPCRSGPAFSAGLRTCGLPTCSSFPVHG